MRTSSRSRLRFARTTVDAAVGLALLFAGLLVLAPLAHAQTKRGSQDSVLTGDQIKDLKRQLDAPDSAQGSDLWEDYKKYRDDGAAKGRSAGERVKVGDSVVVEEDERILGDVVSIGGDVVVKGEVDGDVVSVGGDVDIHDGAKVTGDAVSVGGRVEKMGDATVLGETVSVNVPIPMWGLHGPEIHKPKFFTLGWRIAFFIVGVLLVLLFNAVAGKRLDVVSRRVESEPGQSFLIGLLGAFGTPIAMVIAFVLLAITIIGLLLFPVLLILVWLMLLGGFAATSIAVGRRVVEGRRPADQLRPADSSYLHVFVGFLLLHGLLIVSTFVGLMPGPFHAIGIFLAVLGWCVLVFATTVGYGAVLLSRLGKEAPASAASPGRPAPPSGWPAPPATPSAPPPPPSAWSEPSAPPPSPPSSSWSDPTAPPRTDVPGGGTA